MIHILLATYQSDKYLSRQLDSILNQSKVDSKIHIYDDGSTDDTLKIIDSYSKQNSNIFTYSNAYSFKTPGLSFLYILSKIEYVDTDLFAFSDHDDIWNQEKLYRASKMLDKNSANLYSCPVEASWPSGKKRILYQSDKTRDYDCLFEAAGQGCSYVFDSLIADGLLKASKFINQKGFTVKSHDWVTYIVCRAYNLKWFFDKDFVGLEYIQHCNNDLGAKGTWTSYIGRLKLIFSGWYKSQIIMYACIYKKLSVNKKSNKCLQRYVNNFDMPYIQKVLFNISFVYRFGRRLFIHRLYLIVFTIFNRI